MYSKQIANLKVANKSLTATLAGKEKLISRQKAQINPVLQQTQDELDRYINSLVVVRLAQLVFEVNLWQRRD